MPIHFNILNKSLINSFIIALRGVWAVSFLPMRKLRLVFSSDVSFENGDMLNSGMPQYTIMAWEMHNCSRCTTAISGGLATAVQLKCHFPARFLNPEIDETINHGSSGDTEFCKIWKFNLSLFLLFSVSN